MKLKFLAAVIFTSVLSSPLNAAQLRVDEFGNSTYGVYLNGEELNGLFDTVIVDIRPDSGFAFANPEGRNGSSTDPTGTSKTFINAFLSPCPCFGGGNFSILGPMVSETQVAFTAGPLGETIDTVNGPNVGDSGLYLVHVWLPRGTASANVKMVSAGTIVADLTTSFGVPEPSMSLLLCVSVLVVSTSRENHRSMRQ